MAEPDAPGEAREQETSRGVNTIRLYRTREEQREAGLKRQITPWLTISGLAEGEMLYEDFDPLAGSASDSGLSKSANIQLGLVATPSDLISAELILEYDTENYSLAIDEALISLEKGKWELSLGKQYTPFGVYFSAFASSAVLEFGETQSEEVAAIAYEPNDDMEIVFSLYRGQARSLGKNAGEWNWAMGGEFWLDQDWSLGLSYQSDLADADGRLLADYKDRYINQVGGVSAYLLWAGELVEASFEVVAATGSFEELDRDRNRPVAWNTEVVRFFTGLDFEIAFRFEGSREIEDEPRYQYGTAATWRAGKYASLTVEYLHGEFEGELATTDDGTPYDHVNRVGAILSIEF